MDMVDFNPIEESEEDEGKDDAISSKVTGVIDVTRAPKFLGALKVVPKLVASDQKIGRSWMLATLIKSYDAISSKVPGIFYEKV